MDMAWDRERGREISASELGEADRGRVFGCTAPSCPANLVAYAIPRHGRPAPHRCAYFRTKAGPRHSECDWADRTVRLTKGREPVKRTDGVPKPAPGRVEFSRTHFVTKAAESEAESAAARPRSISRGGEGPSLTDHVRTCTTIKPVCEFARDHSDKMDAPLDLPHVGLTTYADAIVRMPTRSPRAGRWRIWRAWLPFDQPVQLLERILRIEAYTGSRQRRGVLIDCGNWKGNLHERLETTVRERLDAVRTDWRAGVKSGCELFVFAPETLGTGDLKVAHPGMLSLLIRRGHTVT